MKIARHSARLLAIQSLYQWLLTETSLNDATSYAIEQSSFPEADIDYLNILVKGVVEESNILAKDLYDALNRKPETLSPVEHAILLVGTYELKNHPEIPFRVIIDEAVRASKTLGSVDGYRFVNGVLDKIAEKIRGKEILTKKGHKKL